MIVIKKWVSAYRLAMKSGGGAAEKWAWIEANSINIFISCALCFLGLSLLSALKWDLLFLGFGAGALVALTYPLLLVDFVGFAAILAGFSLMLGWCSVSISSGMPFNMVLLNGYCGGGVALGLISFLFRKYVD